MNTAPSQPSPGLLEELRADLMRHEPFSRMEPAQVLAFVAGSTQVYYAPGDVVRAPADGPVNELIVVRRGSISGRRPNDETPIEYGPGDHFPVSALLASRPVEATYVANEDSFCLCVAADRVQALARQNPVLADWLQGRVLRMLALTRQAAQAHWAAAALNEQRLETPLAGLPPRTPLACTPDTPLQVALQRMHDARVGSMLVQDGSGQLLGIFTRHDVLGRVTLPRLPLETPIGQVMSQPAHSLTNQGTLQDAALLMSRHGIRHVPVTHEGRVVNIVSERDLFALQRQSIKQLGSELRAAVDVPALRRLAPRIREFARNLLGQGVQARQLTEMVSHLNDLLTQRLVQDVARRRGADLSRACWLAFGSEGRGEQTVSTDQDNGIVFLGPDGDRAAWLALGQEVNDALADCGYPLCKGGIMAGQPDCCLSAGEWQQRFGRWVAQGSPTDLLAAFIYFDLRPLAGALALAQPLLATIRTLPAASPRFLRLMAGTMLERGAPLNWRGALDTVDRDGRAMLDIKLRGTAIFVDAARFFALAHGLPEWATRARLEAAAPKLGVAAQESQAWVAAFEYLQMLRLRVQLGEGRGEGGGEHPNEVDVGRLNDIDRRMLKEAMRVARSLQQRIALDHLR